MTERTPLPPPDYEALAAALLRDATNLVPRWLPGGRKVVAEWVCGSLSGGEGRSCSVNMVSGKWSDFATGENGGDLISLYGRMHGLSNFQAAVQVARDEGLEDIARVTRDTRHERPVRTAPPPAPPTRPREDEGWTTLRPVPEHAPAPTFKHHHRPVTDIARKAEYRIEGELQGYVVRFVTSDGGKDDLPYTFCSSARDGSAAWRWRQFDEPRPLFLADGRLPGERTVIMCEGEPKTEALHALLHAARPGVYLGATWPGGCKAWPKAAWELLAGATVLLWPDADSKRVQPTVPERKAILADLKAAGKEGDAAALDEELSKLKASKPYLPAHKQPGWVAMVGLGRQLRDVHGCNVQILPLPEPGTLPDGWDAADAIKEGWDAARVLEYFGQAQPLPADDSAAADPPPPPAEPPPPDGPAGASGDDGGQMPWWLRPYWDSDKSRWLVSRKLVIAALRHDPALQGLVGLNQLSNAIDVLRLPPWPYGAVGPMKNGFDLALGTHLSDRYGLPTISRQALFEAIEAVAGECVFHPVRSYLRTLVWDNKPRLDKWLIHALGYTPADLRPELAEYLRQVGRFWLLGMVYRVMEPGCKFDYCPVLEGKGGLYKSTMVEVLGGADWFSNTHVDLSRGREAEEQMQGIWVFEFAEMAGMSKTDVRLIKSFISRTVDRYRPAYGRVQESYPRQVVLVGTTNDRQYLRDRSGNRRFWPVPVKYRINIEWLKRLRDQLLAEAMAGYDARERHYPTPEDEDRLFVPMQESRVAETAIASELLRLLTRQPQATGIAAEVNGLSAHVTLAQVVMALNIDPGKSTAGVEQEIRAWFDREGWELKRKRVGEGGTRMWVYVRPDNWPPEAEEYDMEAPPQPAVEPGEPSPPTEEADDAPF